MVTNLSLPNSDAGAPFEDPHRSFLDLMTSPTMRFSSDAKRVNDKCPSDDAIAPTAEAEAMDESSGDGRQLGERPYDLHRQDLALHEQLRDFNCR